MTIRDGCGGDVSTFMRSSLDNQSPLSIANNNRPRDSMQINHEVNEGAGMLELESSSPQWVEYAQNGSLLCQTMNCSEPHTVWHHRRKRISDGINRSHTIPMFPSTVCALRSTSTSVLVRRNNFGGGMVFASVAGVKYQAPDQPQPA